MVHVNGFPETVARGGLWMLDGGGNPAAKMMVQQFGDLVASLSISHKQTNKQTKKNKPKKPPKLNPFQRMNFLPPS